MISIYMILTALTTAALGKEGAECNFSEPIEGHRCFGAVGQPLLFYLPAAADTEIKLTKDNKDNKYQILIVKNQVVTSCDYDYITQCEGYNGTLNLGNAMKKHSGDYTLEEFNLTGGFLVKKTNVHLQIQVPVSEPVVSQVCLSPEQMKVSCSSDGDGVEFTLTLDGHSLIQTRDQSLSPSSRTTNTPSLTGEAAEQNKTSVSINLHGQLTGDLMCNVQNNVSRSQTVFHLTSCKDPSSSLFFVTVTVAVIVGIIVLLLVAFCLGRKSLQNKSRRPTSANVVSAGDSEVIYADVKVTRKVKKPQPTVPNTP